MCGGTVIVPKNNLKKREIWSNFKKFLSANVWISSVHIRNSRINLTFLRNVLYCYIEILYDGIIIHCINNILLVEEEFKKFAQEFKKFKLPFHFAQQHTMLLYNNNGRFWCSAARERVRMHNCTKICAPPAVVCADKRIRFAFGKRQRGAATAVICWRRDFGDRRRWKGRLERGARSFVRFSSLVMSLRTIWLQLSVFEADPNISISNFYAYRVSAIEWGNCTLKPGI